MADSRFGITSTPFAMQSYEVLFLDFDGIINL